MSDIRTRAVDAFAEYVQALKQWRRPEKTEHTDRSAIERLLKGFAERAEGAPKVQHEPKRIAGKGAPDFKVTRAGMIVGYVETKALGENLDKVLKSDQIAKYQTLRQNIILTDYCEFIWIGGSGAPKRATLCTEDDLENRKFGPREDRVEAVARALAAEHGLLLNLIASRTYREQMLYPDMLANMGLILDPCAPR